MAGVQDLSRRRRPSRMFMVASDLKLQDHLEGTIRLRRGNICQEQQETGRSRGEHLWVKVLDSDIMVKIDKHFLMEVPGDLSGLLEPVSDPECRHRLLSNPKDLHGLAVCPIGSPLWVRTGYPGELAEAELRYRGPLTRGSSAVLFGVQLKGSAVGRGVSNGSYRGHQHFLCPEASALFLPADQIMLRRPSRSSDEHNARHRDSPPRLVVSVLPRTAESAPSLSQGPGSARAPTSPPPLQVGQRVCFPLEDTIHGGEVRYCGPLPGRTSTGTHVGVLLDCPVGNWDGCYKGQKLCHIPSHLYGHLLPLSKVSPEPKSRRQPPPLQSQPVQTPKSILKPAPPPGVPGPVSPPVSGPKIALMPPQLLSAKQALKPVSPPLPKPINKPLPPVPPLSKPQTPPSPIVADQPVPSNGTQIPTSPLRSPGNRGDAEENEDTGPDSDLEVGSMVEVNDPPLFGVIRWIGRIEGIPEPVAGLELDHDLTAGTDGSYLGERHFRCPPNKGLFVKLRNCRRDSRFPAPETPVNQVERCNSIAFAEWGSERVEEHSPPLEGEEARELYQGWKRGIQGHLNSCYLDASLFSLFSCCSSVDWVLLWPTDSQTGPRSSQAQDLLRCEVVNPLRRFGYVCASKTMALRRLLEAESSDKGFTNQEKDPEEFLNKLFQLLRVEPLLKIRSMTGQPQECHLYQLFPPSIPPSSPSSPGPLSPSLSPLPLASLPASLMRVASVQDLLESSFLHAGLKFVEAPSCLPLLMPRFGKDFKMFDAILPSLSLDITDLLDDTLRQCSICQAVSEWECLQCYGDLDITPGRLKQYCQTCNTQVHSHRKRLSHAPVAVGIPGGPWPGSLHGTRQRLALFAVTCIETSHYVSFVKYGPRLTDWLFFDSMADREGGENGFNIPQVKACPELGRYLSLSEEELSRLDPASLKEPARRLLCDAYMCLYHSPELSLYK
ncbi:LOW QUALITY PROTEIN: ubiquitin carboxyl-terminal hydrolase CYLD [Aplochiton taeniatus]